MQTAIEIVKGLNSVQSISLLKRLNQIIFGAVKYTDVHAHLPSDMDDLKFLENLDAQEKKQNLDPNTSVELTQQVLTAFAQDKALAPVLVQAWDDIKKDDSLFVEAIVAVGLIANLTLFMATTEMELKLGSKVVVKKGKAGVALVRAVLNPVKALVNKGKIDK